MITFRESGIQLEFSSEMWAVRKYDGHTYYRGLAGVGLKGVDFVALQEKKRLVLLEIKNFRTWPDTKLPLIETLAEELTRKIEDTLLGLDAIRQMLERKPTYRWSRPFLPFFPAQNLSWPFWNQTALLKTDPDLCTSVICIEGFSKADLGKAELLLRNRLKTLTSRLIITGVETRPLPGLRIFVP